MPYANNYSRREKWRSREDFISNSGSSSRNLMPPEPLPHWDRKGEFFRERRNGYGYENGHNHHHHNSHIGGGGGGGGSGGGGRLRDSSYSPFASGSRSSSEFSPRWGFPSEFRRPPGHIKQGGWRLDQEEDSLHGYSTPRSGNRFMDDNGSRPSGLPGDSRYGRFSRDNRNGFGQKDWRGHSWENNRQYSGPANAPARSNSMNSQKSVCESPARSSNPCQENTPGRSNSMNSQKSVGESPARPSNPDPAPDIVLNAQLHSKDPVDRTGDANGSGATQKIGKENSLGSLDWKPLKWSRSGSLISRGSGFSHSSSSKSTGGESNDVMGELAPKNATPVESPSGDVAACEASTAPPEEASFRKKPRLGWGEGLAKYEKKKVDGPEDNANQLENTTSGGNVKPTHSASALVDKRPKTAGFSDCSSPATPSSFACSSSPGLEKTYGKTTDGDPNNFSVSSMPVSENQPEVMQFSLEKLELNSIANLSSLLSQLLQVDDQCSMDSDFMRSSVFNKLLLWKGDISKTLELTETEIDSLENELKSLKADSGQDDKEGHFDCINAFTRPLPLEVISAKDTIVENSLTIHYARGAHTESKDAIHYAKGAHTESKDEEIYSPGTATSKFVESLSSQKPVFPCGSKNSCSAEIGFAKSLKIIPENSLTCDNEEITGDCKKEDNISDIMLTSNKDTAANAAKVLMRLLPSDDNVNGMGAAKISCLPADTTIEEKFSRRKRLLKFKERVLSLKYRAFHHHWKEDLHLLSSTTHRTKPQKKLDLIWKGIQISNQKHRPSIRSRFASPAGNSILVLTTEILNYTKKLLSDSEVKIYRSSLKMPTMILDEKEKMSSRFVSSNGLVEDPCEIEKEKALINPWTSEEKEIFMEKLSTLGKDFRRIASFLDHKTIADCVQFYYKNHKSECFAKTKKLDVKKQAKPLSSDTYMLTSGKKWSREMNSASLDVLGEASVIASQADQATKTSKPIGLDTVIETSNNAEDERETVAADVLAGICGSLSSEPMSSCITSSIRRPLTPDVTQNVADDGTCSDESCGEMDPVDWTDDEKSLFVRAFSSHGKDFLMISRFVRTKTREQCKVFFSKARKCLSLETIHPGSNDTNGGGSDVEDVCIVETGSVGCSDKSGSRMDEDLPHVIQDVSNPDSTLADLSTSEGNCVPVQLDCKDIDMELEVLCPSHNLVDVQDNRSVESDGDTSKARAAIDYSHCTTEVMDPEPVPKLTNHELVSTCENKDPLVCNALADHTGSRDVQCRQSSHRGRSLADEGVSADMTSSPFDLSIKPDRNGDITQKLGYESKVQPFQEHYFRKCSRLASQNAVTELPLLHRNEVRTNGHAMFSRSVDTEKPCSSGGDVKLFGQILSKPTSVEAANHRLTPVAECDNNGFVGLENVPVRNYGIWDGSKIKVVSYPPSTNASSALLAKYPAAFANGSVSEQQTLQIPVNSGECNLNNACSFSPREYSTGNLSIVDHRVFRNQDGTSPFILDFKQKQNVLPCTGILDPVAVLRSQYSSQRYDGDSGSGGGQTINGVVREES